VQRHGAGLVLAGDPAVGLVIPDNSDHRIVEQYESKYAIIYNRFRIERMT